MDRNKDMKIYNSVTILGKVVPIRFSDEVPDNENANFINDEILIHPKCKKSELARVLTHEFLHAVFERGSISQAISSETEEMIVDLIAKAITENFHLRWR
jgi:hypothetical protein